MEQKVIRVGLAVISCILILGAGCGPGGSDQVTITIAGGASGQDLDLTVAGTQRFMAENPDIRVLVRPVPDSRAGRLDLYRSLFEEQSEEVDVLLIDVVWTGMIAEHALDLSGYFDEEVISRHFEANIANNQVDGRLVAMPWYADFPSLFYRTDLLEKYGYEGPPATWEELEKMARVITDGERSEGNLGFWGYLWQGRPYEGLTCNALEWQTSFGGGNFVTAEGSPHLLNEETAEAFRMAHSWIGKISPPEVLGFNEEETRLLWQKGDAAFLRNWSYVYALGRESGLGRNFAVAPLPSGPNGRAATLGGWQLMVSRYSSKVDAAVRLVRYLTSREEQKIRAVEASYNPTIKDLYHDSEVLEAAPFFQGFEALLEDLMVRPSRQAGERYIEVSAVYYESVYAILNGADPEEELAQAEAELAALLAE